LLNKSLPFLFLFVVAHATAIVVTVLHLVHVDKSEILFTQAGDLQLLQQNCLVVFLKLVDKLFDFSFLNT
jgi:hypothetical protein